MSNDVSDVVSDVVSIDMSNVMSNVMSNDMSNVMSNDMSNVMSNDMSNVMSNAGQPFLIKLFDEQSSTPIKLTRTSKGRQRSACSLTVPPIDSGVSSQSQPLDVAAFV